jgi:hypothetical protein
VLGGCTADRARVGRRVRTAADRVHRGPLLARADPERSHGAGNSAAHRVRRRYEASIAATRPRPRFRRLSSALAKRPVSGDMSCIAAGLSGSLYGSDGR